MEKFLEKLEIYVTAMAGIAVGIVTIIQSPMEMYAMLLRFIVICFIAYGLGFVLKLYIQKLIPEPDSLLEMEEEVIEGLMDDELLEEVSEDGSEIEANDEEFGSDEDYADEFGESYDEFDEEMGRIENDYAEHTNGEEPFDDLSDDY